MLNEVPNTPSLSESKFPRVLIPNLGIKVTDAHLFATLAVWPCSGRRLHHDFMHGGIFFKGLLFSLLFFPSPPTHHSLTPTHPHPHLSPTRITNFHHVPPSKNCTPVLFTGIPVEKLLLGPSSDLLHVRRSCFFSSFSSPRVAFVLC